MNDVEALLTNRNLFGEKIVESVALPKELIEEALAGCFVGITTDQLVAMLYSPFQAIVDFASLCRGDKTGQKISLLFNPHRLETKTITSESVMCALQRKDFCKGLARAVSWREGANPRDLLYHVLQIGINGIQYVNEFPPALARDIYTSYNASRILDPCAGWGGRMIGAAAVGAYYHAFEPSTQTYGGLLKLGKWLEQFNTGFSYKIENKPFEEARLEHCYDIALTSPPYFDTEKYADESTQASIRYSSYCDFEDNFLMPMIDRASNVSANGIVLNVGSRRYPMENTVFKFGHRVRQFNKFRLQRDGGLRAKKNSGESFWWILGKYTDEKR